MKTKNMQKLAGLYLAGTMLLGGATAHATYDELLKTLEGNNTITADQAATLRDKAPKYTVRPAGRVVKDIAIRGRVQAQAGYVDVKNDEGSGDYSTFEVRRARIGLRGTLFDNVRGQLEANLVPGSGLSMRSAFLQWREHKPAYIKLGYDKPPTSLEENTSSASILTIERSLINGLVAAPGAVNGLSLAGTTGILDYGLGIYTDSDNRNSSGSSSEYMYNLMVGLKLDDLLDGSKFRVQATYTSSDDSAGKFGGKFDDAIVFGAKYESGAFGLSGEYFLADSDGNDTKGWYIMPSVYLTENVQAVLRFEQADSDKARGIRAPSRYARNAESLKVVETFDDEGELVSKVDPQAGDDYQSLYLGVNYYLSGHGHKLMFGMEMAELSNTDAGKLEATTVSTAWRMLF